MNLYESIEYTEQSYTYITSNRIEYSTHIQFKDLSEISSPFQSYTYIKKECSIDQIKSIIHSELERVEREDLPYLRIVFSPELFSAGEIPELAEAEFSHYQILHKDLEEIDDLYADRNCHTLNVSDREMLLDSYKKFPKDQQQLMRRWVDLTLDTDQLDRVIYRENNKILGSCELFRGDGVVKLEDLEVLKEYRERGIASAILKSAIAITKHSGYRYIYLITESDSRVTDFYMKRGFTVIADYNSVTFYR